MHFKMFFFSISIAPQSLLDASIFRLGLISSFIAIQLSHGIDFITMHSVIMDMDTKEIKGSSKPGKNTEEREKEETFDVEEEDGQRGEKMKTEKMSDDENVMTKGEKIQGDGMKSSAFVEGGKDVRKEPEEIQTDEKEQNSSELLKSAERVEGEEEEKNDCDKTDKLEESVKGLTLEKEKQLAKTEEPSGTSDRTDCDEKPFLSGTNEDSDSKLLASSETEGETEGDSDVIANGFEVIPEESLHIPFTHYVDHKNLTHSGKSDNHGAVTENEHELVRLLKLYKHSNKDLKDFHRRNCWGTHDSIRGQLWVRVCETLHKAKGNLYDDYEKDLFHQSKLCTLCL